MQNNKKFWQIVKPLFSNKVKVKTTIKLVENYEIVDDKIEIAKLFSEYFVDIVKKIRNMLEIATAKYRTRPNI